MNEHRVAGCRIFEVSREPPLLAQLAEGIAATCRFQQVGGDLRVVRERRGNRLQRLGVVCDRRSRADRLDHLLWPAGLPRQHETAVLVDGEPPARVGREQHAFGRLGRPDRDCDLAMRQPCGILDRSCSHARGQRAFGRGRGRGGVRRPERFLEPTQRLAQFEAPEYVSELGAVRVGRDELLQIQVERYVALGCCELFGHSRVLGVVDQVLLALGAADLVDMLEHAFQRAEPLQQLRRGLVADSRHARDVVAGVALEPDEVRNQLGRHAVAIDHAGAVVHAGVGDPTARGHDLGPVSDELVGVPIAGHHHHLDRRLALRGLDDRGDHIVGLVSVHPEIAIAERLDQRREVGPLLLEQVGARAPLRLVVGIDLLAARVPRVPDHDGRLRSVVGEDLHEHRREPEDRVRRLSGRGRDRFREREERSVREAVAVDQKELIRHPFSLAR